MRHGQHGFITFFPHRWLAKMLTQCRTVVGLLQQLRTEGGLHPRYTMIDDNNNLSVENLIRIEVNKAMIQDCKDFMYDWNKLGEMIYSFANEQGDEFNKQYKKA
jgi:hypothetical protein